MESKVEQIDELAERLDFIGLDAQSLVPPRSVEPALVEQSNAAIEQTETQARQLDEIVDQFRLGGAAPASPPVVRPRPSKMALVGRPRVVGDNGSEF